MKLGVKTRTNEKKSHSKELRREGQIPAVMYAKGNSATAITIVERDFTKFLRSLEKGHLYTTPIVLEGENGEGQRVLVKEIQWHPTTDKILHVDFIELRKGTIVHVEVPIQCFGAAGCVGIKEGGVFRQFLRSVKVSCPSENVPTVFELDISKLAMREHVTLEALHIPENVSLLCASDVVIAVIAKR